MDCMTLPPFHVENPSTSNLDKYEKLRIQVINSLCFLTMPIKACIVRTMKKSRTMKFEDLVLAVNNQLHVNYTQKIIQKQVDSLLDREYIEKKDDLICYVA